MHGAAVADESPGASPPWLLHRLAAAQERAPPNRNSPPTRSGLIDAVAAERGEALGPRPLLRAARLNFEQEPVTQTTCSLPFSGVPLLLQLEGVGLEGGGEGGGEDAGA